MRLALARICSGLAVALLFAALFEPSCGTAERKQKWHDQNEVRLRECHAVGGKAIYQWDSLVETMLVRECVER